MTDQVTPTGWRPKTGPPPGARAHVIPPVTLPPGFVPPWAGLDPGQEPFTLEPPPPAEPAPEVRTTGMIVRITREEYDDLIAARDTGSPEDLAARIAEVNRKAAEQSARVDRVHASVLTGTDGTLRDLVVLHGPVIAHGLRSCAGCDPGDFAESPADWPCTTYRFIAKATGVDLEGL